MDFYAIIRKNYKFYNEEITSPNLQNIFMEVKIMSKNTEAKEAQAVETTEIKEVETPAAPAEVPAEQAPVAVTVKPNVLDKVHELDYNRRLKKEQKKAEKQAAKEAAAAEKPEKDSTKKGKILKGLGVAATFATAGAAYLLFKGNGGSGETVELANGEITTGNARAELSVGSAVSELEASLNAAPASENA